ncbi:tagaturonate reductase [Coraliomargarita akajimensis]|uniref:Mannitol dehydrogenase domain protein n=1 Tax=Coraliomargarita akajimensis (strain DSM 45221 / IAM 15411 / JCM 23193 / KCTC 12865 / 04OKA010-24) TaxID=583355 RepID=D5EPK4_CORAD|nr:tagaturonate reductase [Coraliomargarita akajimensis]ADE53741.1 Mannitol dehydrogenase domain protein [Coraliomargarita akajimensis DSM 45221]
MSSDTLLKPLNRSTVGELPARPERVIQFGEGNFLRAFVDWIIQRMNEQGSLDSNVAVVQPIAQGLGDLINSQNGLYHLILEGMQNGEAIRETQLVDCISRCINPYSEYEAYEALVTSPEARFVVSNTTEAGIQWAEGETLDMQPQPSFPGKMTSLLYKRFKTFEGAADKGLIILCCELIEDNGDRLQELVLKHAANWELEAEFIAWLENSCAFCSTLVDRIVPGYPRDRIDEVHAELGYSDNLVVVGEYYHNWVIKAPEWVAAEFPADKAGLTVSFVNEAQQREIRDQKVRILNGSHTGTMAAAFLSGFDTVRETMEDEVLGAFVNEMVAEEIVPNIPGDQDYLQAFAKKILERFYNPFIRHEWLTISLNSMSKWETRVLPSLLDAAKNNGTLPKRLTLSLAALIAFYRAERAGSSYECKDNADILELYSKVWGDYDGSAEGLKALVQTVLAYEANWKRDLNEITGLTEAVTEKLSSILDKGMLETIKSL